MDSGQEISEHRAPYVTTVQVFEGRLLFGVGGLEQEMAPPDWLVMPGDASDRLLALEPARFVLPLFERGWLPKGIRSAVSPMPWVFLSPGKVHRFRMHTAPVE